MLVSFLFLFLQFDIETIFEAQFKPLALLDNPTRLKLLRQVYDGVISFQELEAAAKYAKNRMKCRTAFVILTGVKSWAEAKERFVFSAWCFIFSFISLGILILLEM